MIVAGLARDLTVHQPARRLEIEHEHLRLQQRRMHPTPYSGAHALEQRNHDSECEQVARGQIRNRDPGAHRSLSGQSRDRHEPAHTLCNLIDSAAIAVRSALPEAADAAVHEPRVDRMNILPRDLEPMLHLDAHVLDDHVGTLDQAHKSSVAVVGFQIERDHTLISVQVLIVGIQTRAGQVAATGQRAARCG